MQIIKPFLYNLSDEVMENSLSSILIFDRNALKKVKLRLHTWRNTTLWSPLIGIETKLENQSIKGQKSTFKDT